MLLTTPDTIRTLQRKLYSKAKQQPACRFHALYDKLYRADILSHAWWLVKANRGNSGIDGIDFATIENGMWVDRYLQELCRELQDKTYRASPVRRVMIPKADGSKRPLGIPTIRDRVAQMALKLVMEPIFEADFCEHSYGFRPKKSAHEAIDAIACAMHQGQTQVIDADLSKYFDSIPHAKLMATVAERIVDGAVLALIKQWLKAPVMGDSENGKTACVGGGKGNSRGTPQGGVMSPLLSNIYLHLMDRIWQRKELCRRDVGTPLHIVREMLGKLGLELNEGKTKIVDANKEEFRFLEFELKMNVGSKNVPYPHIKPAAKAVEKVKARISEITARNQTWRPMDEVVRDMNRTLRG